MPECIICLDCSRLFPRLPDVNAGGRCPACRAARNARPKAPHRQTAKRTAQARFYTSTAWRKLRAQTRARDGSCTRCGSVEDLSAHHLVSIHTAPDRALDPDNVTTLCRSCHAGVSNRQRAA